MNIVYIRHKYKIARQEIVMHWNICKNGQQMNCNKHDLHCNDSI
jgi:hypothetical protein